MAVKQQPRKITTTAPKVTNRNERKAAGSRKRQADLKARRAALKWMASFLYTGQLLTLLLRHGCLTEAQSNLNGPAYKAALSEALEKFFADIYAGKIVVTR